MASGAPVPDTTAGGTKPPEEVLARCLDVLSRRPSALITDIDGTLSRIVPRPEDARVSARASAALEALASRLDMVAVITARDRATAERMVGARGVTYVGNYGLMDGARVEGVDGVSAARRVLLPLLAGLPCVALEDKRIAFSLHFRNCDDPDGVRRRLLALLEPVARSTGTRIAEGKRVFEVVPGDLPDKRSAFARLIEQRGIRGLVYMGDDLSDLQIFRELSVRRAEGGIDGLGIVVVDAETDPGLAAAADLGIDGVDGVEALLTALRQALAPGGG